MDAVQKREFLSGAKTTFPLVIGAVPFGIIFGTLAVKTGLTVGHTMALSLVVFAGSAQFIAIGFFAAGASWQIILLTTFIVNLRHLLYSATLAPKVHGLSGRLRALMAFFLTDETFAAVAPRFSTDTEPENRHWYYLGSALYMYTNWQICSLIGALFGNLIPGAADWGLDFAMPVAFIGMLVPYLRSLPMAAAAAAAGLVSVAAYGLPNKLWLILAAAAGILAGLLVDRAISFGQPAGGDHRRGGI
jgi:4-azaleucine resistance transporter AzlC